MAFQRLFFAAQQGEAAVVGVVDDAPDAVVKGIGGGHPVVAHPAGGIVAGAIRRPAAQLAAQKSVADAQVVQQFGQGIVVEMGGVAAVRRRAHIGHLVHAVPHQ